MGTFNAVPQSAVMRSNSWWRGVSSSSKLRSVDMRSSSSSGIGHDMVESLRASYQNPCLAARRRVRSRALRQLVTGEVVTT